MYMSNCESLMSKRMLHMRCKNEYVLRKKEVLKMVMEVLLQYACLYKYAQFYCEHSFHIFGSCSLEGGGSLRWHNIVGYLCCSMMVVIVHFYFNYTPLLVEQQTKIILGANQHAVRLAPQEISIFRKKSISIARH